MSEHKPSEPIKDLVELDKLVHEPRRFGILNALERANALGYSSLRRITALSQGNLATHLAKLEAAGLIEIRRRYILRRPYARVYITNAGRDALISHWRRLDQLHKEVEKWRPSDESEADLTEEEFARLSQEDNMMDE